MTTNPIYLPLLLVSLISCTGQTADSTAGNTREINTSGQPAPKPADSDPYFIHPGGAYSEHGPTSITRNIIQDRNGDVWLATWEGIIRYDGATFTNYTKQNHLRKFHVFSALQDRNGHLWFGTIGAGIYRYDGKNFTNVTTEDGLAHDKQGCFLQARNGDVWIGTMGGISIYDGESYRNLTVADGLADNDINAIVEDRTGKIWIASRGALSSYDGNGFTVIQREDTQAAPTRKNGYAGAFFNVRSVIEDREGNIWFGGNDGLWRYGTDGPTRFAEAFTGYIMEDGGGNIWTSSNAKFGGGQWQLARYDAESLAGNVATPTVILRSQDMLFGITEDTDGNIWVGSLNGVGRYDGEAFDWFRAE